MTPRWKRPGRLLPTALVVWANWTASAQDALPRPNGSEQASVHQSNGLIPSSQPTATASPQLSPQASGSPVLPTMQSTVGPIRTSDRDGTRTASQPICGRAGRETRASRSDRSSTQPAVSRSAPYSGQPWCRPSPRRWTDGRIGRALAWGRWGTRRRRFAGCRSSTEPRLHQQSEPRRQRRPRPRPSLRQRDPPVQDSGEPRGGRGSVPHDR